jgi:hypothetical protein
MAAVHMENMDAIDYHYPLHLHPASASINQQMRGRVLF